MQRMLVMQRRPKKKRNARNARMRKMQWTQG